MQYVCFVLTVLWMICASAAAQTSHQTLQGSVTAAGSDVPLSRARVVVTGGAHGIDPVLTDYEGRFTVSVPKSERYAVTVTKAGFAYFTSSITAANVGDVLRIRMSRGAAISGRLTDESGVAMVMAAVTARRVEADGQRERDAPNQFSTVSDDRGEYRLGGLPAGRYTVGRAASPPRVNLTPDALTTLSLSGDAPLPLIAALQQSLGAAFPGDLGGRPGPVQTIAVRPGEEVDDVDFVAVAADPVSSPIPPSAADAPSVIRGRVLGPTGDPVVANVALSAPSMNRNVITDARGRFAFAGLTAGSYTLAASRAGYYGGPRMASQQLTRLAGPIAIGERETVDGIEIVLPQERAITGAVIDERGEPIQGATVQALQLKRRGNQTVASEIGQSRQSDDRGRYRLFGLPAGEYLVLATLDGSMAGPQQRDGVGFAPVYYPGTSRVDAAMRVRVASEGDASGVDLVLASSVAVRIAGIALDAAGNPLVGSVRLVAPAADEIASPPRTAPIGPAGDFVFTNVPPGEYVVQAIGRRGPGRSSEFGIERVSVSDRNPPALTIRTSPGATLEGRIVVEGGEASVTALTLAAFSADGDQAIEAVRSGLAIRSNGAFYVSGLIGPTGFALRRAPEGWYVKSVAINGADATDAPYDFGFDATTFTDAEIIVSAAGATISGRTTDISARPIADCAVIAFSVHADQWTPNSRYLKSTRSARDGTFRISGLPAGEYWLAAVDHLPEVPEPGKWLDANLFTELSSSARRVTVRGDEAVSLNLRVASPRPR